MSELTKKVYVNLELELSVTDDRHVGPLLDTFTKVVESNLEANLDGIEIIEVQVEHERA